MSKQKTGKFTDSLLDKEVNFSKKAGESLKQLNWAKKLVEDSKISKALTLQKNPIREYEELNSIKSALFEVRFAYALQKMDLDVIYEARTGIGDSTVDFKIEYNNSTWLIELTSIRESNAVKQATNTSKNGTYAYQSITDKTENSPEIQELIKLQNVICNKAQQNGVPHKFPEISDNTYHMIVIDVRSSNAGMIDHYDYHIVTYGSQSLVHLNDAIYCRGFKDKVTGNIDHIKGVFEQSHPNPSSQIIRDRIHFICFVKEKEYKDNEIINKMDVFPNPNFFRDSEKLPRIWLFNREK